MGFGIRHLIPRQPCTEGSSVSKPKDSGNDNGGKSSVWYGNLGIVLSHELHLYGSIVSAAVPKERLDQGEPGAGDLRLQVAAAPSIASGWGEQHCA